VTLQPVHATVVARWSAGRGWRAVLLSGPSGVGKSDLATRLIHAGWRLVCDDYAHIVVSAGAVYAIAPPTIAGRMEVRGVGIAAVPFRPSARVVLAVALSHDAPERLPDPDIQVFGDARVPRLRLDPREVSASEKVAVAFAAL
jgi:serine kinase of HPr protein (carbohydrate metabolism regulator)